MRDVCRKKCANIICYLSQGFKWKFTHIGSCPDPYQLWFVIARQPFYLFQIKITIRPDMIRHAGKKL